jgi:lipoprotein-anchoring transpeptidase ErfK/SrfK
MRRTLLSLLLTLLVGLGLTAPPAPASAQEEPEAPSVPADSGAGRRIVYSNGQQRVWLVEEDGTVAHTHLVSGRRNFPRPGTYAVFSKSEITRSGSVSMRYMVRFFQSPRLAVGFHSIPFTRSGRLIQSERQLGTYRSHGCVRQRLDDAAFLYVWAPIGTTVVVVR